LGDKSDATFLLSYILFAEWPESNQRPPGFSTRCSFHVVDIGIRPKCCSEYKCHLVFRLTRTRAKACTLNFQIRATRIEMTLFCFPDNVVISAFARISD
jgi:hypothetical protein